MRPNILIIEEFFKDRIPVFEGFKIYCMVLGYDHRVCNKLEELPNVLADFNPDIAFWVMQRIDRRNALYLEQMRLEHENIKIVSTTDIQDYGYNVVDMHFFHLILSFEEFQEVITKFFG